MEQSATAPDEPTWKAAAAKPSRMPRTLGAWVLVGFVVLGVGLGVRWWTDQPERALGNHGDVVAERNDCGKIRVTVDGLTFETRSGTALPASWTGPQVAGELDVTSVADASNMTATFTADDGASVLVYGGETGKVFFDLGCAITGP